MPGKKWKASHTLTFPTRNLSSWLICRTLTVQVLDPHKGFLLTSRALGSPGVQETGFPVTPLHTDVERHLFLGHKCDPPSRERWKNQLGRNSPSHQHLQGLTTKLFYRPGYKGKGTWVGREGGIFQFMPSELDSTSCQLHQIPLGFETPLWPEVRLNRTWDKACRGHRCWAPLFW